MPPTANSGLVKKIKGQAEAMRNAGFGVVLLYLEGNAIVTDNGSQQDRQAFTGAFARLRLLLAFFMGQISTINSASFTGIYIRHFLLNPLFIYLLLKLKKKNRQAKVVLEFPTYPYLFEYSNKPFAIRAMVWLDQFTAPFLKRCVDRVLTFRAKP
ncbi:MAG: hypothetical protein HC896_06510 [Bacteroidales bacterium]|nr:hypothetical protein [Bacteroidales bacterium]